MNYFKAMLTQCGIGPSIEKQIHEKKEWETDEHVYSHLTYDKEALKFSEERMVFTIYVWHESQAQMWRDKNKVCIWRNWRIS